MTAVVTHIAKNSNADGSHSVRINHDGKDVELTIPLQHLEDLVGTFQVAAILRAHETARNIRIPRLDVTRVDIAHQGPICELMVSTIQTGTVVLLMKDDLLRHMKAEIDRVLSHRGGSAARN